MHISYDTFPPEDLRKERDSMFTVGTAGDKLPQYINAKKDEHTKNIQTLKATIDLFKDDELKPRHVARMKSRMEQELRWAKHYDECIDEYKKGLQVAKAKAETEAVKKAASKKEHEVRAEYEKKLVNVRKERWEAIRIKLRAEWEEEQKKLNVKRNFWQRLIYLFTGDKKEPVKKAGPAKEEVKEKKYEPTKVTFYMVGKADDKKDKKASGN